MLVDLGSRDGLFLKVIKDVRDGLLHCAGVSREEGFECILMQGSGTFSVEATISSIIPKTGGKLLVLANGAYGERIAQMAEIHAIPYTKISYPELEVPRAEDAVEALKTDPSITHVAMIHHETTTGALNPVNQVGRAIKEAKPEVTFIVDSMSGFGCYPIDLKESRVDFLVSSSNKCIEGVPGFAYALADREKLLATEGSARTLSLDLLAQWKGLEANGQFRFTPPTHALLAFDQALKEHVAEGGVEGRLARYTHNFNTLKTEMAAMGFHPYLDEDKQGVIITTFLFPDDPAFDFPTFYNKLQALGLVIYPGKLTKADCFRIGSIGRLFERDMRIMTQSVKAILLEMGVQLPVKQIRV